MIEYLLLYNHVLIKSYANGIIRHLKKVKSKVTKKSRTEFF